MRREWVICGRVVGTATDCDGDASSLTLYDLESKIEDVPNGDVTFDFDAGRIQQHDAEGTKMLDIDLIEALSKLPKVVKGSVL